MTHDYPEWNVLQPNFKYHGRNVYAYLLAKYGETKTTISKMKKGVMLINTTRGALVNTKDIINALKNGQIGYLGIDVYEEEKGLFFEDHSEMILQDDTIARLMTFNNVFITSHQAFLTDTALKNISAEKEKDFRRSQ